MTDEPMGTPTPGGKRPAREARVPLQRLSGPVGELQRSCLRIAENLRDTFGADGCAALLSRAIIAGPSQPALATLWRQDGREIFLDGVAAAVDQHGQPQAEAAVAALMAALEEVLGRLVGEDLAMRIIHNGASPGERRGGTR
jgi:hypothetical protein